MQTHRTETPGICWNMRARQRAYGVVAGRMNAGGHAIERSPELAVCSGKVEVNGTIPDGDGDLYTHASVELDAVVVEKVHMTERPLRQRAQRLTRQRLRAREQ